MCSCLKIVFKAKLKNIISIPSILSAAFAYFSKLIYITLLSTVFVLIYLIHLFYGSTAEMLYKQVQQTLCYNS